MLWLTVWIDPVLEFQEEDGMSDSYQVELFFRGEKKFLLVNSQASCWRQNEQEKLILLYTPYFSIRGPEETPSFYPIII